jgi:cytochrome P450
MFFALVCLQHPQPHYRPQDSMTLRPVNNPAAGVAQRKRLSEVEVRSNILIFIAAGHETTANSLS